jgi:hypothetical protein
LGFVEQPLRRPPKGEVYGAASRDAATLAEGWHRFEPERALRWTDGDAELPASIFAGMTGMGMLIVQMGATTQYVDDGKAEMAA